MNIQEAYKELEIDSSYSEEQVKKQFKTLSKKYHPDINKDPDSESKFKKINEAYQTISNPPKDPFSRVNNYQSGYNPFEDIFSHFNTQQNRVRQAKNIHLSKHISFKDSVFGIESDLEFERLVKCDDCDGEGEIKLNNGCTECGGKGQTIVNHGNAVFVTTCKKCHGQSNTEPCKKCDDGCIKTNTKVSIKIPGGIRNGNTLQLQGIGNYASNMMGMEGYTNVLLKITVDDSELIIVDNDVVSTTTIDLIDAVKGKTIDIDTVVGKQSVDIPKLSKNKDEIIIPNLGVNRIGAHKLIINVSYPDDIEALLEK